MRASVQSVMKTLWPLSSSRTVSRSSVEWWPESGAMTSTVGCPLSFCSVGRLSVKRLKRSSRQKGFSIATRSCTATAVPSTSIERMSNSGFS